MAKIEMDVSRGPFLTARFTLDEWRLNNQFRYRCSETQRESSERLVAEAAIACESAKGIVRANKEETDHQLLEKLNDIEFRKRELLQARRNCVLEIDALTVYEERLADVLKSVKRNALAICEKCLAAREGRLGIDLVHDDVERDLLKEREAIRGAEDLLARVLREAREQIRKLKAMLYQIDHDLENKESNLRIDRRNVTLKETDFSLRTRHGISRLDESCVMLLGNIQVLYIICIYYHQNIPFNL